MEKNVTGIFSEIKKDITTYLELRFKLLKIETYEKTGKAGAALSFIFILLFIVFFAILFLFFGLGYYLGEMLNSQALGMFAVGALYLIILGFVILFRKGIMRKFFNLFISELRSEEDDEQA